MTNNIEIAKIFSDIADILEIKSENQFRIRAYRRAAQNIEGLTEDVADITNREELLRIPGIGKDLAEKIAEFIDTGKIQFFEKLKREVPKVSLELITIPGIGPKTAKILIKQLKIKSIRELEKRAKAHKLATLPGIRRKTEENILRGIQIINKGRERMPLGVALPLAEEIISHLTKTPGTKQIAACGSLRRQKETIRDIDILVTSRNPKKVMDAFVKLPLIREVLAHGSTKSSAIVKESTQVDIRVVKPRSFGAALMYFTGSKEHNIHIRELAAKKGFKINEYGIFNAKTHKRLGGNTEEQIYKILGLGFVPPELREDAGEIETAKKDKLPKLIGLNDIRGDLHVHTKASDGSNSIDELAEAAMKKGYEYIVISDHSKTLRVAGGLQERELLNQIKAIKKINKRFRGFRILAGAEVDIINDGSLDFDDKILAQLDIVIAAIHTGFKQSKEKLTMRIVKAMQNKYVNIVSHLTGRLIGAREPYPLNLEEIFRAAKETNTALEISAYPQRLDLNDTNSKKARESGIMFSLGTDLHAIEHFENMRYGVSVARRGWLEKKDILNTYPAAQLLRKIKKN